MEKILLATFAWFGNNFIYIVITSFNCFLLQSKITTAKSFLKYFTLLLNFNYHMFYKFTEQSCLWGNQAVIIQALHNYLYTNFIKKGFLLTPSCQCMSKLSIICSFNFKSTNYFTLVIYKLPHLDPFYLHMTLINVCGSLPLKSMPIMLVHHKSATHESFGI